MRLFRRKKRSNASVPTIPTNYPYGLCVKTESGHFLMREKIRLRVPTIRVLDSWHFNVVNSSDSAIKHIPLAGKVGFRDGTLIKNIADSRIYLVTQSKRRHVTSPDVFDKYGLRWDDVVTVSEDEANLHIEGEVLN